VDAALSVTPGRLGHTACDTLQRAVIAVCEGGLTSEWADLFVSLVGKTADDGDRPQRVLDLARSVRALVDLARNVTWAAVARELCTEGVAADTGVSPTEVVRQLVRWVDLPEGRLVLQAFCEYEKKCGRHRTRAAEVRRALAAVMAGGEDCDLRLPARVLAETLQTAGEFGIPPYELSLEIRGLAALEWADQRDALDGGLVRLFREQGVSVAHLITLYEQHCSAGHGSLLRAWLPTLLSNGLTEGPVPELLFRGGFLPPGGPPSSPGTPGPMSPNAWESVLQIVRAMQPLSIGTEALELVFSQVATADLEKRVRPLADIVLPWAARPGPTLDTLRTAFRQANVRQDGHAALLAAAGLPGRMSPAESNAFFLRYLADHPPFAERTPEAARYREKTVDVIRRLHNLSHGFGALKVVNQRMPDGGPSAYDEFGDDLFARLDLVNASSNDLFPGCSLTT
jgi:hypothetical protein